jgi:hypothetical protein
MTLKFCPQNQNSKQGEPDGEREKGKRRDGGNPMTDQPFFQGFFSRFSINK